MKKLAMIFVLVCPLLASADVLDLRYEIGGAFASSSVNKTDGNSRMEGFEYHLGFEGKIDKALFGNYDVGFLVHGITNEMSNKNNGPSGSEKSRATIFELGTRIYALNVFFGLGVAAGHNRVIFKEGASVTRTKYAEYGGYGELGVNLQLSDFFYIIPNLKYRALNVDAVHSLTPSHRSSNLNFGLALGVSF